MLHEALQRAWLARGPLAWTLRPLAGVYGAVTASRHALYRGGWRRSERLPVPVVVVGNVLAGGAGKTPVVMEVVRHLQAAGVGCGVVSRGWGRQDHQCREVTPGSDAAQVGDEPLLIARRCGVPVFVAPRRADAARALLARHPAVQVLVSDDGLQHLALARDLEICVFDARGLGNGWLLPAGPLREPWPREVDLVLRPDGSGLPGFAVARRLQGVALRADGSRRALSELASRRPVALAGIARPEAFFAMLRGAGLPLRQAIALPDHHDFTAADLPPATENACLICTEKDAVKLWRVRPDAWAVPLALEIEPAFWQAFDRLLAPRLSSVHGLETA